MLSLSLFDLPTSDFFYENILSCLYIMLSTPFMETYLLPGFHCLAFRNIASTRLSKKSMGEKRLSTPVLAKNRGNWGLSQGSPGQDLDLRLQEKKTLVKEPGRTSGGEPSRSWEGPWKSLRGTHVLSEYITLMVNRGRGTLLLTMEDQACLNELWP